MQLKDTLNQHWSQDTNKFGYRMMLKLGWSQGKGLGKNEDGMASHVKVDKRAEKLGIGSEVDASGNLAFKQQIHGFNGVLDLLKTVHPRTEREGSDGSDDGTGSVSSGEERKKSAKKRKRVEYEQEMKEAKEIMKQSKKKSSKKKSKKSSKNVQSEVAASVKRKVHHRLVKAKDVSKYSQHDLKAILGHS